MGGRGERERERERMGFCSQNNTYKATIQKHIKKIQVSQINTPESEPQPELSVAFCPSLSNPDPLGSFFFRKMGEIRPLYLLTSYFGNNSL